jgi:Bacteriocin-protection, YdeI or OmpD-Associated/Domain of unknown function (DUF1905)
MPPQTFETTVESGERGRVFITIPFDTKSVWGKQSRYYVKGTLNQTPYDGSLGVRGGVVFMPLNKALQQVAHLKPGDHVTVVMELAEAVREAIPEDLKSSLQVTPEAAQFFDGLTAFYQNTYIEWIVSAKKSETRRTRITQAVELLKSGKNQP